MRGKKAIAPVILSTLIFLIGIVILGFILMYVVKGVIDDRKSQFDLDFKYLDGMQTTRTILMHKTNSGEFVHEIISKRIQQGQTQLLKEDLINILNEIDDTKRWIFQITINSQGSSDSENLVQINQPQTQLNTFFSYMYKHDVPNDSNIEIKAYFKTLTSKESEAIKDLKEHAVQSQLINISDEVRQGTGAPI